ncbi:MAG: hypothetical protein COV66_00760 [Nitrospinae bacterium CG11_big_fil_rev_8_21_14_0_20_45_15]|jgi:hypothetical protein|nr:MAG: hypothetical protein COV66_00760 [Nitrospinae bacterium CG11_big_fil_rev_8_21_14_0_20_45_15]
MKQNIENNDEKSAAKMKKVLIGAGLLFAFVGLIRQWPIIGKSYMEFIEGDGYLGFIMGLVMIVLGFSVRLLMGLENEGAHTNRSKERTR